MNEHNDYKEYGRWTVLKVEGGTALCHCSCGTEKLVRLDYLISGRSKSCGCLRTELLVQRRRASAISLDGKKFGKLLVCGRVVCKGKPKYSVLCDCGTTKEVYGSHLTSMGVTSCGCDAVKIGADHVQWSGVGDISGGWWSNHVGSSQKSRARKSGATCPITITIKEAWDLFLLQNRECALSGLKLTFPRTSNGSDGTASLDRIDSSKGYVSGNVQWVHKQINIMKNVLTQDRFIELCCAIASKHG